jgi:hypothetical protein
MNKERYNQIIDEVYKNYAYSMIREAKETQKKMLEAGGWEHLCIDPYYIPKSEFINKCKTDQEFSERWGLKIEERELSDGERITLAGFDYEDRGGIGYNMLKETVDMDNTIPRRLITLEYNGEKIEVYE